MKYFDIDKLGWLNLIRPWPKRLTKKRALQLSIRKWEAVIEFGAAHYKSGGDLTCALCYLHEECEGCLVAEYVKNTHCDGTPYYDGDSKAELVFLKKVYLDKYGEEYP